MNTKNTASQPNVAAPDEAQMDAMRELVSDFRKAAYEFGQRQNPADHALMMRLQQQLFIELRAVSGKPKVESIADDAQFKHALSSYTHMIHNDSATTADVKAEISKLVAYIDSKLRAPADQAASVAWTITKNMDMGTVYDAAGKRIATTYAADAQRFVDAHNSPQQSLAPAAAKVEIPSNEEFDRLYKLHSGHPADFAADVLERWGGWPMGVLGQGGSGVLPLAAEGQVSAAAPADSWHEAVKDACTVACIDWSDDPRKTIDDLIKWHVQIALDPLVSDLASEGQAQTSAASDVLAERQRQVEAEGWTAERDDRYNDCQLAAAAATYALCEKPDQLKVCGVTAWPWSKGWWRPTTYRRNLVKAGALLLAEIERVDRAAEFANNGVKPDYLAAQSADKPTGEDHE